MQGSAATPNGPSCGTRLTEHCLTQSFTLPHSVLHAASISPLHCLTQSFTLPHSVLHAASFSPSRCLTQSFMLPHSDSGERGKGSSTLGQLKKTGTCGPMNSFIILFLEMLSSCYHVFMTGSRTARPTNPVSPAQGQPRTKGLRETQGLSIFCLHLHRGLSKTHLLSPSPQRVEQDPPFLS